MKTHLILCTHNGENYITEQIHSILEQEDKIDNLHLFDFGSSDSTRAILERFGKNFFDIYYLECIPGPKLSFFKAIEEILPKLGADDLIFFCDQDDIWQRNKVALMKKHMLENRLDIGWHNFNLIDSHGKRLDRNFYSGIYGCFPGNMMELPVFWNLVVGNTICVSSAFLKKFMFTSEKRLLSLHAGSRMHDEALVLFALFTSMRGLGLDKVLSLYRIHDGNLVGEPRFSVRKISGKLRKDKKFVEMLHEAGFPRPLASKTWPTTMRLYHAYFNIIFSILRFRKDRIH